MPKPTPNKIKITNQTEVDAIPYSTDGKQPIWWSTELDHFGVRAGAREKTFVVGHRVNGQWKLAKLGRDGQITVQKAIKDAKQILGDMVGGIDPVERERTLTAGGMTLREGWELTKEAMRKKNRSQTTFDDYQSKIDCHLSDWLDLPLAVITPEMVNKLHTKIGEGHGKYMANGTMRVLRLIWNRVRRQHRGLPETPTSNVDFYEEHNRTNVITNWPAWWSGVQQIANHVRRDFYLWLAFSGCRAGETMEMEVKNLDLDKGIAKYPITKTVAFELPLSDFMVELLRNRIAENVAEFGEKCRWVFPSATAASGHLEEERLTAAEPKLFRQHWSPHTLRHSWITISDQKVKISDSHQRMLTNHKLKRVKNDAHAGYIHPDLDDLRHSQQLMTDYLIAQIKPTKPGRGKKHSDNVVHFKRQVA